MTKRLGEFSLIANYFAPLTGKGAFNLRDDAAEVSVNSNQKVVITQDACAEGIHFFKHDPANLIAKKALRVNLSDLAAKGAKPKYFSLALGLGEDWTEEWVAEFARGLGEDISNYEIALTGGDTFRTDAGTVISITAIGEVPQGKYVSRAGGDVGDRIYVTGTIGDAALGLQARLGNLTSITTENAEYLNQRYQLPQPRTEFASLVQEFASASMDVSDGLIGDLQKLCSVCEVGAQVYLDKIPLSTAATTCVIDESKWLETAVTGGDDYEILLTIPLEKVAEFESAILENPVSVTCIGEITMGNQVLLIDKFGHSVEFAQTSYDHTGNK